MTETELPTLEEMLPPEKLAELKEKVTGTVTELYQPLVDEIVVRSGFADMASSAKVTCNPTFSVSLEDGNAVIHNHLSLGIAFTPEVTSDPMDTVARYIVTELFSRAVNHD